MWLQTSDWHIPNSWASRQQDEEGIDDKVKARKDKGENLRYIPTDIVYHSDQLHF